MSLATNVIRRGGRYAYRARVPVDLVARLGRFEITRSLKTADPGMARRHASRVGSSFHLIWDKVRNDPMLSREQIDELIRTYFHELLEADRMWRVADMGEFDWKNSDVADVLAIIGDEKEVDEAIERSGKHPRHFVRDFLNSTAHVNLKVALAQNDWHEADLFMPDFLAKHKIDAPKGTIKYRFIQQGLIRAYVDATRIMMERSNGNWAAGSEDPLFQGPPPSPAPSVFQSPTVTPLAPKESLSELLERFLMEKPDIAAKTVLDYRAAIRALEQTPDLNQDISRIRLADIVRFKDMLLRAPTNWTKRFVGKTLIEAIQQNEKSRRPTLSAGTINGKYLSPLSTFFKWAAMNGLIEKSPIEGVRVLVAKGSKKAKRRLPFTSEQLQIVFSAPVFTGCRSESKLFEPGAHRIRDHKFWTPLIALWSGARLNEIGQLLISDVRETDDVWCFHFIEDADGEQKRLKSEAARRVVPIHPELEKLGFLEYVQGRSKSSGARLFPHWRLGKDGYYSSGFSKWFARFLTSVDLSDPRLVFHSSGHAPVKHD